MTGFLWSDDAEAFFGEPPRDKTTSHNPNKRSSQASPKSSHDIGSSSDSPLSVGQLNAWIKRLLDRSISTFWLSGEIGNLTQSSSGHVYLTLKDSTSQISAVIWRSTFERIGLELREGMAVLVQGRVDVYAPKGTYQIIISRLEQQGLGALQAAFRRLHAKLEKEGLFAAERKKTLPTFPRRIGFVTSPSGAAIHDFIQVLKRRWPGASVLIVPTRVQGDGASQEIARAIRIAERVRPKLDVLVVGRGGGSLEDLWCFNEEEVVRAVAACSLPTVSAVGHEIDVTLCDLAADVRALTPSEAAERIVPSREEIIELLDSLKHRIDAHMHHRMRQSEMQLRAISSRPIFRHPERLIEPWIQELDELHQSADQAIDSILQSKTEQLEKLAGILEAMSPLKTLARGYSVTSDAKTQKVLQSVNETHSGQLIKTRFKDGEISSRIVEPR